MKDILYISLLLLLICGCEKKDGLHTEYYSSGDQYDGNKYTEVTYKNGKKHGLSTEWWKTGQKKWEGTYKDDSKHGKWTRWHDNGKKFEEENYKDGKENGLHTIWYENGQKKWEENYKDGKKDGLARTWYENGQECVVQTYKDGKNDGLYTRFDQNGEIEQETTYKDDEIITTSVKGSKNKYYNVTGGSSSSISTCKTCGISYTVANLPYGKYCSQACCRAIEGMSSKCN